MDTRSKKNPQTFGNGEHHSWYNFVLGYSDRFVGRFVSEFDINDTSRVLDPFCGTGTTLVECVRRGVSSIGIDASPFSCFVSRVKTHRPYHVGKIAQTFHKVQQSYEKACSDGDAWKADPTYVYVKESGMLDRGWISFRPLKRAIVIKRLIAEYAPDSPTRNLLWLCLSSLMATTIGNMRFGPEIYRGPEKRDVDPIPHLKRVVREAIADIAFAGGYMPGAVRILRGDARACSTVLNKAGEDSVDYIITSPPYPTEHDYTRNTRLELALLEFVSSSKELRSIKDLMIRSNTKNLFATDEDHLEVSDNRRLKLLSGRIAKAGKGKTSGFARLYMFTPKEELPGRMVQALRHVLRWQTRTGRDETNRQFKVDNFILFFTTKLGPEDINDEQRQKLASSLERNLTQHPAIKTPYEKRSSNRPPERFLVEDFASAFKVAIPKMLADVIYECDWYVEPKFGLRVLEFSRPHAEGKYTMLHMGMLVCRQKPPKEERMPGDGADASIRKAHSELLVRVFEHDVLDVAKVIDVGGLQARLQESLDQVVAHREKLKGNATSA
jgi:hypothetical protein